MPTRSSTRGESAEAAGLSLATYLEAKRVSELQEFYSFWGDGTPAPSSKADLKAALTKLVQDEEVAYKKVRILSRAPMQLLLILIRADDYRADIQSVFYNDHGIQLEYYEVEAAARALSRRGFLEISRDRSWINYGKEVYRVPREVGETVSLLLAEERRGPREVFTLRGHLSNLSPQRLRGMLKRHGYQGNGAPSAEGVADFLLSERGSAALLDTVSHTRLRDLFRQLIEEYGGVISRSRYEKETGSPVKWDRKRWQRFVEAAGLGTMSNISLDPYGIKLEGESIVVFKDIVENHFGANPPLKDRIDRVLAARIDLLTDLAYFLRYVARNPVRVTQAKTLYKSAHTKISEGMVFKDSALADRDEVLTLIFEIAAELELLKVDEERLVQILPKGEAWEGLELTAQVRMVYEFLLEERLPEGRDFHLRKIRRIVSNRLRSGGSNGWRAFMELPFVARNEYLAALEDEGIKERYKNRFQYSYDPPKATLPGLASELVDWIGKRLFVLGIVDVGMAGDEPIGLRLTELGLRCLGVESEDAGENGSAPLVVNPDFEILLFPEGNVLELVHTLDRFAVRTKSEEVSQYRVLKEGVERAVVKGMTVEQILGFLAENSRTPIPQNVEYSIREWGEKIRFATQKEVVLLQVDSEEVLDRVIALECMRESLVYRVSPTAAALREPIKDWRMLEDLRSLGVYLKD